MEKSHTFDSRNFLFALACLVATVISFSAVRLGTLFASERILEASTKDLRQAELELLEIRTKRTMRSVGEVQLLSELQEYQAMLSTRTIGTASADSLSKAHGKFIGADLTTIDALFV